MTDAPAVYAYARDPEVTRYLAFPTHQSIAAAEEFLARCAGPWDSGQEFCWLITLKDRDEAIGSIGCRVGGHGADIGYVLAKAHWGRGYMTEAGRAVVAWASARPDIHRVWAFCAVQNAASARVMEKVGMSREGILRKWFVHPNISPEPCDCLVYARVRPG
jgi:RimJ/RimL family protein N-acetyltransferase